MLRKTFAAHPKTVLASIALTKAILFLGAYWILHVQPFVGSTVVSNALPAARRMLTEGRFNGPDSRPDSKVAPGYSALLAVSIKLLGTDYPAGVVLVQCGADLLIALAIYRIARRLAGPSCALLAGVAWQFFPPALMLADWIVPDIFLIALFSLSTAWLLDGLYGEKSRWIFAAGLAMGASTYFRPTAFLLPLFYLPVGLMLRKFRQAVVFACSAYLVMLPWVIRNVLVLDDWIPVTVGFGTNVLQGSDARFFKGEAKPQLYPAIYAEAARTGITKPLSDHESGIDAWMGRVGLYQYQKRWRDRSFSFIPFAAHKFLRLWYGTATAQWKTQAFLGLCSLLVVPCGWVQFYRWRIKWQLAAWIFAAQLAYLAILRCVGLPMLLNMLPLYPLLLTGAVAMWMDMAARWLHPGVAPMAAAAGSD
jgi:4-amino-4-deoxy-L-arabinose transferase-like glycosyltransferase